MTNDEKPVVVGVDGSPSALHAVRWAAREAQLRDVPLRLMHVSHIEPVRHPRQVSPPQEYQTALLDQGQHFLDEASEAARDTVPDLPVSTDLRTGNIADTLVNESKHAALTVLGSRGLGGFGSLLLGSVAVALSAHGHCPIVVIHAPSRTVPVGRCVEVIVVPIHHSRGRLQPAFLASTPSVDHHGHVRTETSVCPRKGPTSLLAHRSPGFLDDVNQPRSHGR